MSIEWLQESTCASTWGLPLFFRTVRSESSVCETAESIGEA